MKKFGVKNALAVPRLVKVVVNVGGGQALRDARMVEVYEKNLNLITGQRPLKTTARKSIANFKIRMGMNIGMKVTLRGKRMYDFLDKLVNVTLPRLRDFRGLPLESLDRQGNLNIGFKEQVAFPEISAEAIEKLHGLEVTVVTSGGNREQSLELLKQMGFPFREK